MKKLSMWLALCAIVAIPNAALAVDQNGVRPYVVVRAAGSIYDDTGSIPGLSLANPSQYPFPQIGFGVNFGQVLSLFNYSPTGQVKIGEDNLVAVFPEALI